MERRVIIAGGGTGGHLYPALNIAAALGRRAGNTDLDVLLVGAQRGIEARVLPDSEFRHRLLPLEPLYRSRPWRNWTSLVGLLRSSRRILKLFDSYEPDLVVGTGGYVAGPVAAWAVFRRLPTAIQEQNSYPGVTTRVLAPYVDQVHLGSRAALRYLDRTPRSRIRIHGNPIRSPSQRPPETEARESFGLGRGRVVLVVGGSQGARPINEALLESLSRVEAGETPALPEDVQLLWSTGPTQFEAVSEALSRLRAGASVRALPYIEEMDRALSIATIAISRSGALALAELSAWGIPALLVPYRHAAADHQRENAKEQEAAGAAEMVEESELVSDATILWQRLAELLRQPQRLASMAAAAESLGAPDAADRIADDLLHLIEEAA